MPPSIEDVIAAIPAWAGAEVGATPIAAGLTNQNWRVTVDGVPHFVRIPGAATELLAVDRANERHNTRAAATAASAQRCSTSSPTGTCSCWHGSTPSTMSNEAFAAAGAPSRVADALRRLHAGPTVPRRLRHVPPVRAVPARRRRARHPDPGRVSRAPGPAAGDRGRPGASIRSRTVPCHNDLLAENYLDDGERLWIVDYEYSGNNDPTFELGNTCQELGWDDVRVRELCAAYFGEATDALVARMRLQMIMSDVGWTLWAAIQAAISTIDFDFYGWAEERWARAQASMDGPDFDGLARRSPGVTARAAGVRRPGRCSARASRHRSQVIARITPAGSP